MPRCNPYQKFTLGICVSGSLLILLLEASKVEQLTIIVLLQITRSRVNERPIRITFDTEQKVIRSSVNRA